MDKTGCCGSLIRMLLITVNTIFFVLGLTVFVLASILRWGKLLHINSSDKDMQAILDLTAFDEVSITLLALGAFIIITSVFGLVGAIANNKCFLLIYEIIVVALFICHITVLIIGSYKAQDIEVEFRRLLNSTINDLNSNYTPADVQTTQCHSLYLISDVFSCCAYNGPDDFVNATYATECCRTGTKRGCADTIVSNIQENGVFYFVVPSAIVLGIELIIIILVPFLIGSLRRQQRKYLAEEGNINRTANANNQMRPTTSHENPNYYRG